MLSQKISPTGEAENLLVRLWSQRERGAAAADLIERYPELAAHLPELEAAGLTETRDGVLALTPAGEERGRELVRRHRLAEVLLREVFEMHADHVHDDACLWEHVLSAEVTDTICTFLGHPRRCPHGSPIPPGACCTAVVRTVTPLVQPLTNLRVGAHARISFIAPRVHRRLDRLASLGIVPGTHVALRQKSPSYVIRADETEVAIEADVARDIFVREIASRERGD